MMKDDEPKQEVLRATIEHFAFAEIQFFRR